MSPELAKYLSAISRELGRQVGVLLSRDGFIRNVILGDATHLELPDIGRLRGGAGRFRGLRLVHTHLRGEPLTQDDLNDLALLRLDLVAMIQAEERRQCRKDRTGPHPPGSRRTIKKTSLFAESKPATSISSISILLKKYARLKVSFHAVTGRAGGRNSKRASTDSLPHSRRGRPVGDHGIGESRRRRNRGSASSFRRKDPSANRCGSGAPAAHRPGGNAPQRGCSHFRHRPETGSGPGLRRYDRIEGCRPHSVDPRHFCSAGPQPRRQAPGGTCAIEIFPSPPDRRRCRTVAPGRRDRRTRAGRNCAGNRTPPGAQPDPEPGKRNPETLPSAGSSQATAGFGRGSRCFRSSATPMQARARCSTL